MIKPLASLTLDDLDAAAVWRVEDRDGFEVAVSTALTGIPSNPDDLLIVRARFRLANGWILVGFSAPGEWDGVDVVPPVIIHEGRHLPLADEANRPTGAWAALAPQPDQVFPVTAEPDGAVGGSRVSRRYGPDGREAAAEWAGRWRGRWTRLRRGGG